MYLWWHSWLLRIVVLFSVAGFAAGAYGLSHGRNQGIQSRRELCHAENQTRQAVRDMLDIAFAPSLEKAKGQQAKAQLVQFREQLERPLRNLECSEIVNP